MNAIVIGSGVGGLAIAIRLQRKAYSVTVIERNAYAGGKLHDFKLENYRFDGGPSLFTMPQYVTELLDSDTVAFTFSKQKEACRYFWEDGTELNGFSDPEKFAQEVERKLRVPASEVLSYFDHIRNIYDRSARIFLEKSLHKTSTWLEPDVLKALLQIGKFDLFKSMHQSNKIRIGEEHLVQLFDRFATYNGSNPYKAPGILNVIPWLEHGFGTFYPDGGMINIPKSLEKQARAIGVKFLFDTEVISIETGQNRVQGLKIQTKGSENPQKLEADLVVSNADVFPTYRKLMPKVKAPEKTLSQERSSSAIVFYWGVKKTFDNLGLHNILFSESYKEEFQHIFEKGTLHDDPTIYINISSKCDPNDAPEGYENWFVMVNAPHHQGQDWNSMIKSVRASIIRKLDRRFNVSMEQLIEVEKTWNPAQIQEDTGSHLGSLYGTSSNNQLSAFLRHPNFHSSIKGLYFCGGSVHPGGGIPLALLSARITANLIPDANG